MISLTCTNCNTAFDRSSKDVASTRLKSLTSVFCSKKCYGEFNRTRCLVECKHCAKQFTKNPNQIAKTKNNFCSKSCATTYNNAHKTYGTRRSKLEHFLESKIRETYPTLTLLCNDKTAIQSELDFYFPELHLAIELNGILHFEPIYGDSKLAKIVSNDNKKAFLCSQNQINLAVIDTSMHKNCSKLVQQKFWNIVKSLLEANMAEG